MARHCESALAIAQRLVRHDKIERVHYPGLPSHPQHALARGQMNGFGGMVTLVLRAGLDDARRFLERLQIFVCAGESGRRGKSRRASGDHDARFVAPKIRGHLGIDDSLVRLSIGVEDVDDLMADVEQALR
jgi:cystathionine gamma-lyase